MNKGERTLFLSKYKLCLVTALGIILVAVVAWASGEGGEHAADHKAEMIDFGWRVAQFRHPAVHPL